MTELKRNSTFVSCSFSLYIKKLLRVLKNAHADSTNAVNTTSWCGVSVGGSEEGGRGLSRVTEACKLSFALL